MFALLNRAGGALATALAAALVPLVVQAQGYPEYHHMWGEGWGWGHMLFGSVMMIVFLGAIIALIVLAVRCFSGAGHGSGYGTRSGGGSAMEILRERFARGEIDKAEFEDRRRVLGD